MCSTISNATSAKETQMKKVTPLLFFAAASASNAVYAAGLQSGTDAATNFKTWLFGFLGVLAFIYLMYKGLAAWAEKAQWFDFLVAIGKVAAVGGVLGLTTWAWSVFA